MVIDKTLMDRWGLDEDKVGAMKGGMFKNSTYWGKKTSVLKSGICKYTRREMWEKMVWCVIEMALIGATNKGIFTNLMNRLRILTMEELICLELGEISKLVEILEEVDRLYSTDFEKCIGKLLEFCDRLKPIKRGRVISYMNCWWKFVDKKFNLDEVVLDKVLKYRKTNDTDELLKYGELFIKFLEEDSEKIFAIYHTLYNMEGNFGNRFRRKDAIYLLMEIVKDIYYSKSEKFAKVFDFAIGMFHRKQMTERRAFGIWVMMMVWKFKGLSNECRDEVVFDTDSVMEYMRARENIEINEDFVVKDYHVNKSHGLAKFATVGAFVVDEDLSIFGENGEKYKKLYIDVKCGKTPKKIYKYKVKKEAKKKVEKVGGGVEKSNEVEENKLELIEWDKFSEVKVLEDGVCGLKVCCIRVVFEGRHFILKEMRRSFNLGRDYMIVDGLKGAFGVRDLKMSRIRSNMGLEVVDKSKKSFVGNWRFGEREVVYCMMEEFENLGDLGKNKKFLEGDSVFRASLKIRLFDGLFRSSDNILRNILVNSMGDVLSIDEGDIYGKRTKIFNKSDWFLKKEVVEKTRAMATEIVEEWTLDDKVELVAGELERWGFGSKVEEMKERFGKFGTIVGGELE
jgi:hypothetical protein